MNLARRRRVALFSLLLQGAAALCATPAASPAATPAATSRAMHAAATPAARQQALDRAFLFRRGMGASLNGHSSPQVRRIPSAALATARTRTLQLNRNFSSVAAANLQAAPALAGSTTTWQSSGPIQLSTPTYGLVTGRISSVAADPNDPSGNTVYLGATGGGVWKSTNAAGNAASVTFTPLTDDLSFFANSMQSIPSLSIGAVSVEPGNPNVLLAGTGDPNDALDSYYGVGILRSVNGGQTWSLVTQSQDAAQSGINYAFAGVGFAGFAWSTTTTGLVVAAASQSVDGLLVNTQFETTAETGLYYSQDAGQTWHLATVEDSSTQIIQSSNPRTLPPGTPATAVVWNAKRGVFIAAIRFHGYYSSTDGVTWTRLASQPGANLTTTQCPADPGSTGSTSCPIFRGALAVQPVTGDTFALTTDINNVDQGLYRDVCAVGNGSCTTTLSFGTQINDGALDDGNAIDQADYNLSLAAVSSQQDTILFAGTEDIYRCSLANSCTWRNTTNDQTCASGLVAPSTHAIEGTFGANGLVYFGNDGGLWRTTDTLSQTGAVCSASDAAHFQNLNAGIGSLAEISHLAVSPTNGSLVLAGMGEFGVVASESAAAQGTTGAWQQLAAGEGSLVAIDPTTPTNWYVSQGPGLSVYACPNGANCGAGSFGTAPVVGRNDIAKDADYFIDPAPWALDPGNAANLIVGTCRMWLGPVTGGWSSQNLLSGMLDGNAEPFCDGNAELRSIGAGGSYNSAQGGEQMYAGMAGPLDGGGAKPGHVYGATVPQGGGQVTWSDLWRNPVTNTSLSSQFNGGGYAISSIAVDSHDASGKTVYVGIAGFPYQQAGVLYRSTDGGAHWANITNSLPGAPVNRVLVDPSNANYVYVAGDFGVYYTSNIANCTSSSQNCWGVLGSSLPNAPVTDLQVYRNGSTNVLEASTYGRGIWTIGLTTTPVVPAASLSPASYTFPSTATGSASTTHGAFTLHNTSAVSLTIGGVQTSTNDYAETNNCGGALAAGGSCTITVTFTPAANGDRPGTLTVTTNAQPTTLTATLDGTGLKPGVLSVSPSTLSFPSTATGAASSAQNVTLQNSGGAPLTLSGNTIAGANSNDFSIAPGSTCGSTLAAGAACTVPIVFNPYNTGTRTAQLQAASNAQGSPALVSLTGYAVTPPFLTLSPTSLTFPSTGQGGTSPAQTITVTNTGGATAQLGTSSVSGDYLIASNSCGATLAPSTTCSVAIEFQPQAQGNRAGLFTLPSPSMPAGQVTASLSGTGLQPSSLAFSPASLSFGAQQQGTTSAAQTLQITNNSGGTAQLGTASITGDFAIATNNCASSLAVGSSCSIAVTFAPSSTGSRSGVLTLAYNGSSAVTAALAGTGTAPPLLSVSPTSLTFPTTAENTTSATQAVTVTNSGGNPASLSGVAASLDFTIAANSCPQTLAAGSSCTLSIAFMPPGTSAYTGTATLSGTFSNSPLSVALKGNGATPAAATLSPASLTFPDTPQGAVSAAQVLTVTSTGGVAVSLGSPTTTADYQITANNCPASLAVGASCTVSVAFHPAALGARPGTFTQPVNMGGSQLTAPLSGNGLAPGVLSLTPTSLAFGAAVIGHTTAAQNVSVTNTGGSAATVGTPSVAGDYALVSSNCPASLAVGQACTLSVSFTPTAAGDRPGQLTVPGSGQQQAAVATLDGTGVTAGTLTLAPASLAFGSVAVGSAATAAITATNAGGTAVHLSAVTITGDYNVTGGTCTATATLAANGGSCSATVTFKPTATGQRSGTLTLTGDGTPSTVQATLNGVGATPGTLTLSPGVLAFGSVVDGTSSSMQAVTATNSGGVAVSLGTPSVSGAGFRISSNNCSASLAAGSSCTLQLVYAPANPGAVAGALSYPGQFTGTPAAVQLTGTGLTPGVISFSPSPVAFGSVVIRTAAALPVKVTNTGGAPVTLGAASTSSGFGVSGSCPATLEAGQSCTLSVSFTPAAAGALSGLLSLPSSLSSGAETDALSGTGVPPAALAANPGTLNFVATETGQRTSSQTVTFENTGGAAVALNAPSISGADYALTNYTCGASLAPGATCTASVAFTPVASGARTGTLLLSSSSANGPSASVALAGTGLAPARLVFAPASLSFGTQADRTTSTPQSVTLTNAGDVSTVLGLPVLTGPYAITQNTCSSTLAAGASCTLTVLFAPTTPGSLKGSLTGAAPGGSPSATATLSGTGQALVLAPQAIAFTPALNIGATSATVLIAVQNLGTATLTLGTPTLSGDFAITQNSCSPTLAPDSACAYGITFTPTAGGARTGVFTLSDGAEIGMVQLSGQGLSPATDGLGPASLSFPLTVLGTVSGSQNVSLTNGGDATLAGITVTVAGPFTASNNCGFTLGGHLACAIAVAFAPVSAGSATGTLTVTDALHTQVVVLGGTGALPPNASASPSSLDFGPYAVGVAAPAQTVTLANQGQTTMSGITTALSDPNFVIASGNCSSTLAPGSSCTMNVVFTPQAPGTRQGTLTFSNTSGSSPLIVNLQGSGEDYTISAVGSGAAIITAGQTATWQLQVTPVGASAGTLTINCAGAPATSTCTANPSTLALSSGTTGDITLTVATTLAASAAKATPAGRKGWLGGAALALLLPVCCVRREQRRRLLLLALAVMLLGSPIACGVHASGAAASGATPPGQTPSGSYTLTVGAAFPGATRTATVQLTVQ